MIERLIEKLLRKGQLTLVTPDGKRTTYGPGGGLVVSWVGWLLGLPRHFKSVREKRWRAIERGRHRISIWRWG